MKYNNTRTVDSAIRKVEVETEVIESYELEYVNRIIEVVVPIIEWQERPLFFKPGRTANRFFKLGSRHDICLKIKGIGLCTYKSKVLPPSTVKVKNLNPHCGISSSGEFFELLSSPSPLGALYLENALNEFKVASYLVERDIPSIIPVLVSRYDYSSRGVNIDDSKDSFGVVVSKLPSKSHLRFNSVINLSSLSFSDAEVIKRWFSEFKVKFSEENSLVLLGHLGQKAGGLIRRFSESGLYRYSSALDNFGYSRSNESGKGEVYLTDLDTCRFLSELSEKEVGLQLLRDAASYAAYLISTFSDPKLRSRYSLRSIKDSAVFYKYFRGHYFEVADELIARVTDIVFKYFTTVYCKDFKENIILIPSGYYPNKNNPYYEFARELEASYLRPWVSRSEVFTILLPLCRFLHESSALNTTFPIKQSWQEFWFNLESYGTNYACNFVREEMSSL